MYIENIQSVRCESCSSSLFEGHRLALLLVLRDALLAGDLDALVPVPGLAALLGAGDALGLLFKKMVPRLLEHHKSVSRNLGSNYIITESCKNIHARFGVLVADMLCHGAFMGWAVEQFSCYYWAGLKTGPWVA